ncbi:hypothetical protein MOQ19_04825 [Stenotrophomonas maltophilia]|nr:hypothetical protein [Stenotrophomonas maltophilia]
MSNDNKPLAAALPDIESWSKGYKSGYARAVADHAARQPVGEPAAWVHEEDPSRVISASQKATALRDQGASGSSVRPYSVPAYLHAPAAQAVDLVPSIPSELAPVVAALNRFDECAEDCDSEGCDIGRDWFDALTTIGLLKRTQRSPAVWTMTAEGERLLALINGKAVGNG